MPVRDVCRIFIAALRDRNGNVAIIVAATMMLMLTIMGYAIDYSAVRNQDRQAQNAVDLAAIAAASRIDNAEMAAFETLKENGIQFGEREIKNVLVPRTMLIDPLPQASVEIGRYERNPAIPIDQRFVENGLPYNAARVVVRSPATRYFTNGIYKQSFVRREAVAYASSQSAFSIGSRLASLNGGILNAVIGPLLGGNISLSLMDYEALIDADVSLFNFLDAVATEINFQGGTYNDLLDSSVQSGDFFSALAAVSRDDPAAGSAANSLAASLAGTSTKIPLSNVFNLGSMGDVGIGQQSGALDIVVGMFDLMNASAAVADGDRQVTLNLDSTLAGLGQLELRVTIGEPMQSSPWYRIGETGDVVHTAQTRLAFDLTIGGSGLLAGAEVNLPIYVEAAYADGELKRTGCSGLINSQFTGMTVATTPGVVEAWVGDLDGGAEDNFERSLEFRKATIAKVPLLTIRGRSHVKIGNESSTDLVFTREEVERHAIKTAHTTSFTNSLLGTLIGDLELELQTAGLSLSTPTTILALLTSITDPVTKPVDDVILHVLSVLGVKLGEADVRADGGVCGRPVLVE